MCDRFFFLDVKELDNVNVYIYNEAAESALLSVFGTCRFVLWSVKKAGSAGLLFKQSVEERPGHPAPPSSSSSTKNIPCGQRVLE